MPALWLSSLCCDKPGAVFMEMLCAQSVSRVHKVRDIRAILFKIFLQWPSFQLSLQKDNTRKTVSKIRDVKLQ